MNKKDQTPPELPDHVELPDAAAQRVKKSWDDLKSRNDSPSVAVPGANKAIEMGKMEFTDNVVSVWTTSDASQSADFVIVNPPTAYRNSAGQVVEDPLAAIAFVIDGANK